MAEKLKYCVECGREKKTIAFSRDRYCSENCRKSMTGEGPKVGWSQEFFDRNHEAGIFLDLHDIQNWGKVLENEIKEGPTVVSDLPLEVFPKRSIDEIAKDIP